MKLFLVENSPVSESIALAADASVAGRLGLPSAAWGSVPPSPQREEGTWAARAAAPADGRTDGCRGPPSRGGKAKGKAATRRPWVAGVSAALQPHLPPRASSGLDPDAHRGHSDFCSLHSTSSSDRSPKIVSRRSWLRSGARLPRLFLRCGRFLLISRQFRRRSSYADMHPEVLCGRFSKKTLNCFRPEARITPRSPHPLLGGQSWVESP